jgi:hypothetical protein
MPTVTANTMRTVKAGVTYFALVFGAGFLLAQLPQLVFVFDDSGGS